MSAPRLLKDTVGFRPGMRIGQYEVIAELDRGGMAVVYRTRQIGLDREVALKVLPPVSVLNTNFIDRFRQEARSIAKLNHNNIVKIIEVGVDEGIHFIAMEYIPGQNLYKYLINEKETHKEVDRFKEALHKTKEQIIALKNRISGQPEESVH